jgi:hypothetical protein
LGIGRHHDNATIIAVDESDQNHLTPTLHLKVLVIGMAVGFTVAFGMGYHHPLIEPSYYFSDRLE